MTTPRTSKKGKALPLAFAAALRRLADLDGMLVAGRATGVGSEALLAAMAERTLHRRTFDRVVAYVAASLVRLGELPQGAGAAEAEIAAGKWAATQARERGLS